MRFQRARAPRGRRRSNVSCNIDETPVVLDETRTRYGPERGCRAQATFVRLDPRPFRARTGFGATERFMHKMTRCRQNALPVDGRLRYVR